MEVDSTRVLQASISVLAILFAIGCEGSVETSAPTVVTDSMGVRLVANRGITPAPWTVRTEPVFLVGWSDDGPHFSWPQSGAIQESGGALVGEFSQGLIYDLDPAGRVDRTLGGKGEGPGEFQGLDAILQTADTILVSDGRLNRMTRLARDGSVETSRAPTGFLHHASALLDEARILLVPGSSYSGVTEIRQEWVFQTQPILALDRASGSLDTLITLPHLKRWYGDRGAPPGPLRTQGLAGGYGDGFAWARSDVPEVRWFDRAGRLVQIARWDEGLREVDAAYVAETLGRVTAIMEARGVPEERRGPAMEMYRTGLDLHDGPIPLWDDLIVDREGSVWLREFGIAGDRSTRWRIVSEDGRMLGWIDLPGVVAILDVTDDRLLAVLHDEFDVPAVAMFELVKR